MKLQNCTTSENLPLEIFTYFEDCGYVEFKSRNSNLSPSEIQLGCVEIVRRVNAHDALVEALRPFAEAVDGNLEGVGGGTSIAISTTVQRLKDAKAALALAAASETRTEVTPDVKTGT